MLKKIACILTLVLGLATVSKQVNSEDTKGLGAPAIGKLSPVFSLPNLDGEQIALKNYSGKFVVLEWTNYGCPYVKKHYQSNAMQSLQKEYAGKGVIWLSICSSAPGKQGFMTAAEWKNKSREVNHGATEVLLDPEGRVGRLYGAKTTPHMFIISPKGLLIYKGAIDDTPSTDMEDIPKSKNYVRMALEEARAGKAVSHPNTQPYGCSVKY